MDNKKRIMSIPLGKYKKIFGVEKMFLIDYWKLMVRTKERVKQEENRK